MVRILTFQKKSIFKKLYESVCNLKKVEIWPNYLGMDTDSWQGAFSVAVLTICAVYAAFNAAFQVVLFSIEVL